MRYFDEEASDDSTRAAKLILQTEAGEGGLAALAMVAAAHGLHVRLDELRRCFPLLVAGATPAQLIDAADHMGLSARLLQLDMDELSQMSLPSVLHWDLHHFVVLSRVRRGTVTVLDPAVGERRLQMAEVSAHFTGVALELSPTPTLQPRKRPEPLGLRQLFGPVRGLRLQLAQISLVSLLLQATVLLGPLLLQWVVDKVLPAADRDLLTLLGIGFALLLLLQTGLGVLRAATVQHLASRLGLQWMRNVLAHLFHLPAEFFERRPVGHLIGGLEAARSIQRTIGGNCIAVCIDGVMAPATLLLMLLYSWKLALLAVLAVLLHAALRAVTWVDQRDGSRRQLLAQARERRHQREVLRGMRSLKAADKQTQQRSLHDHLVTATTREEGALARLAMGCSGVAQLLRGGECIAAIWLGAALVMDDVLSFGMLIAYLAYKDQFIVRVTALLDAVVQLRLARLQAARVADMVLAAPEPSEGPHVPATITEMRLEVEDLCFRYGSSEPWVLKNCSFSIAAGEAVAIVGVSGSGKTTLVKLLLGLLQPTSGSIRIGGRDLQQVGARQLRALAGVVMQDDQLFSGSIADNISFLEPVLDMPRVEAAARLVQAHEEIVALPMGYHGLIGDSGSALSAGQQQRLLLARALYRHPRLLVLDEATCHLDGDSERQIGATLAQLRLTRLIITHRPQAIGGAGRVRRVAPGAGVQEVPLHVQA